MGWVIEREGAGWCFLSVLSPSLSLSFLYSFLPLHVPHAPRQGQLDGQGGRARIGPDDGGERRRRLDENEKWKWMER